jgi:predicted nucleic acid-binding protein
MNIDRNTLLFFDSSCLIAAAGSPQGGSGFLLSLCARGYLKAAVSIPILLEAQRNIRAKLGEEVMKRFYNLLALVPFSLASLPGQTELKRFEKSINRKDLHVVAAALEIHAPYLLALDKGLVQEIHKANIEIQALTPGDFIKTLLPKHVDYPGIRGEIL